MYYNLLLALPLYPRWKQTSHIVSAVLHFNVDDGLLVSVSVKNRLRKLYEPRAKEFKEWIAIAKDRPKWRQQALFTSAMFF